MTPRETFEVIDAANWRSDVDRKRDAWIAWHTAALSRAKRLPPLRRLISAGPAKQLVGKELERRRREHREITESIDVDKINEAMRRRHGD
jgi:hypothetical protein